MRRKALSIAVVATAATATLMLGGCPGTLPDLGPPSGSSAETMTLVHAGVDFSTGTVGDETADVENSDGDVIVWPPHPNNWIFSGTEVWFRPTANTDDVNYIKDMGEVSLRSVIAVPQTWDGGPGLDLPPLQVGHVYVVKCLDGYAKFLVKAIRVMPQWEVDVEYVYSPSASFAD